MAEGLGKYSVGNKIPFSYRLIYINPIYLFQGLENKKQSTIWTFRGIPRYFKDTPPTKKEGYHG